MGKWRWLVVLEWVEERGGKRYWFWCPGCKCHHYFTVGVPNWPSWQFNGNLEKPTVEPSIFCDPHGDRKCHLFIRDGMIQYGADCWHELKGQTIPLPEIPKEEAG
jgi:hypothetical protein